MPEKQMKATNLKLMESTILKLRLTKLYPQKKWIEKLNNELRNTMKIICPSQNTAFTKAEYKWNENDNTT